MNFVFPKGAAHTNFEAVIAYTSLLKHSSGKNKDLHSVSGQVSIHGSVLR
jgi:hypothetical protein